MFPKCATMNNMAQSYGTYFLNPNIVAIHWQPDTFQIGQDPDRAIILPKQNPDELALLQYFSSARRPSLNSLRNRAQKQGLDSQWVKNLTQNLIKNNFLTKNRSTTTPHTQTSTLNQLALNPVETSPEAQLRRRKTLKVGLTSLHPLGLQLAQNLASNRIGSIIVTDETAVSSIDLQSGVWDSHDLGLSRRESLRNKWAKVFPETKLYRPNQSNADFVFLMHEYFYDSLSAAQLSTQQIPYLNLFETEQKIFIGPLISNQNDLCLNCLHLPRWLNTGPSNLWQVQRAARPQVSSHVAASAAGIASTQLLRYLGQSQKSNCNQMVELDPQSTNLGLISHNLSLNPCSCPAKLVLEPTGTLTN